MKTLHLLTNFLILLPTQINALSLATPSSSSASESYKLNQSILRQSLSSIAKKLTYSPEVIIPEPTDPTALLLQQDEVSRLSLNLREKAKANSVFVGGSLNSLRILCNEQESAKGNFPGPVPVIYCDASQSVATSDDNDDDGSGSDNTDLDIVAVAEAGASGIVHRILGGNEVSSVEDVQKDTSLSKVFQTCLEQGICMIPEVVVSTDSDWDEEMTESLMDAIVAQCGDGADPAAILMTVGLTQDEEGEDDSGDDSEEGTTEVKTIRLPAVTKELSKRIPILGSVRVAAGGGRMGKAAKAFKAVGFNGILLKSDCLPGFRFNVDLDQVGSFWSMALSDLKSTRSKSFNFRSKVELDRDIPLEWFNYQKGVMESGALGGSDDIGENPLDSANGDYQGF